MTSEAFRYTLLISSLPRHPLSLFSAKQTPLSRIQLDSRLALLTEQDAVGLKQIEQLVFWSHIEPKQDDEVVADAHLRLAGLDSEFGQHVVEHRLLIRLIVAALRRRQQGLKAEKLALYGELARAYHLMMKHWNQADMGLTYLAPWVTDVNRLLVEQQSLELEKFLLDLLWQTYIRWGNAHRFDFAAVILYVLRWDIICRWTSYDAEQAELRFNQLLASSFPELNLESLQ